ncbi:MAG: FkbM family methyltransferase [Caulobacteraceae bacterium]
MPDPRIGVQDVQNAYKWILGREADPEGLWRYARQLADGDIDQGRLRQILLDSEEFVAGRLRLEKVSMGDDLWVVVDRDDTEFGQTIVAHGTWEPHIVATLRAHLRPGDVFVDIGANVGVMSFNAADQVGPGGKVLSFEPLPRNIAHFLRGVAANRFEHVQLYPFALSDRRRLLTMSAGSNSKASLGADPLQVSQIAQAIPGDSFLLGEPKVDLIKIDIEGHEPAAITGLQRTFARHKPIVLCEFNPLCLRGDGDTEPEVLADQLFDMTDSMTVIEHSNRRCEIGSTMDLMHLWRARDDEAVETGHLPRGWVHFDLLFKVQ